MKIVKYALMLLLPALSVALGCQNLAGSHSFKGTVANAANLQVLLEQVFFDPNTAPAALGRVSCDASGNFTIEQKDAFPAGLYRLTIGAKRMFFMLDGKESAISFKGDLNTIDRMQVEVTGSETFNCFASNVREMLGSGGQMTLEKAKGYIQKGCTPLMRAFFTVQLLGRNAGGVIEDFKTASKALSDDMPGSKYATDFASMVTNLEQQMAQQPQETGPIQVGQPAPEINLPGPDGKLHSLAALKGKVVLLDFWASWCRPCRMANPHVVEMYSKYKDKGFEVFSVSLDRPDGKDAWVSAIKQDGLVWNNHVSDLQFWNSAPAATYGVHSIPSTFLIDRSGNIAAVKVDPRTNLEEQLLKILN